MGKEKRRCVRASFSFAEQVKAGDQTSVIYSCDNNRCRAETTLLAAGVSGERT